MKFYIYKFLIYFFLKNEILFLSLRDASFKSIVISFYNYIFKKRIIKLEGGIGDLVYNLIILQRLLANEKYKKYFFICYYPDGSKEQVLDKNNHSLGSLRLMKDQKNKVINFRKELIDIIIKKNERLAFKGIDLKKINGESWFPDNFWILNYPNPNFSEFNTNFFEKITNNNSTEKINKIIRSENNQYILTLHLRRSAKNIISLSNLVSKYKNKINKNIKFIILGSNEHDNIPLNKIEFEYISILDSYTKGYNTIDIINVIKSSNFFIGGRGGFELISWYANIPTINFFDNRGFREINNNFFPINIINSNKYPESLIDKENYDEEKTLKTLITFINNDK